jgi:rhamnose utilization protein RhaD (predicted bifunctional aldolase and dehydrogenase)
MTVVHDPALVPTDLVAVTRTLGDPAADLVILAEGNTSTRVDGDRMVVKASGARMDRAEAQDFVIADPAALLALIERSTTSQDDLMNALRVAGAGRSASIETLVHAAAIAECGATWVAHTHPTAVVGSLATTHAGQEWAAPMFPDEAVMLGQPLWVPYLAPGLDLGRGVLSAMRRHLDAHGEAPRLVLLGNHGIVALGQSADEIQTITAMTVKAARVRAIARASGEPAYLDRAHSRELAARPDEAQRRQLLNRETR